jgi:hypothetical protein
MHFLIRGLAALNLKLERYLIGRRLWCGRAHGPQAVTECVGFNWWRQIGTFARQQFLNCRNLDSLKPSVWCANHSRSGRVLSHPARRIGKTNKNTKFGFLSLYGAGKCRHHFGANIFAALYGNYDFPNASRSVAKINNPVDALMRP